MADGKRNDIAINIQAMLDDVEAPIKTPIRTECYIYNVPHEIRKLNEDAYTPKVISIGPFHHWNPNVQKMKSQKLVYLKRFRQRTKTNLDSFVNCVEGLEQSIRRCYSEGIGYSKEYFIEMILLDAVFILEFFCLHCYYGWEGDDALPLETWLIDSIMKDLCLLENQLPFFVLDKLYNVAFASFPSGRLPTFLDFTFHVLASQNKQNVDPESVIVYHFTNLLRTFHLPSSDRRLEYERKKSTDLNTVNESCEAGINTINKLCEAGINTVNKLREAGIKFRADKTNPCLLDLRFSGRTLKIPQLTLDDETEMLFCNMIALEQCHYLLLRSITDYVCVLSRLIKTNEDADVLVKNGIIINHLDHNNNMARLFYRLGKNAPVLSFNSEYYPLLRELKKFRENPMMRMVTAFRRDYYMDLERTYCKTPLQTLATLGGILLLILTVIQTACSILQVV